MVTSSLRELSVDPEERRRWRVRWVGGSPRGCAKVG